MEENASFDKEEKILISRQIKNISLEDVNKEYSHLKKIDLSNISCRSRIGNNIVDYFTFTERLNTRGKYDMNYYDFIKNIDKMKEKKFIANMLEYYEKVKNKNNTKNNYIVLKEVYNICISAINIIRPIVYMQIYDKYKPTSILDFCAGWGGAAVASSVLNIPKYTGIEINHSLLEPYNKLKTFLTNVSPSTEINIYIEDALKIDYSKLDYDLVFTSPPYYFIQKYENNVKYKNKDEMNTFFYIPLFTNTFKHLKKGGYYILNVNKEIYEKVCIPLLGNAMDIYPYGKSKRQNNYNEMVYVWLKNN
jgi:16S rRNA G966 N2-methylase RsmD